eukprot:TRINITY_DN104_c0_g1_i1.p1 TRINITY_DN104_c0_g1~~TRINITY_DN104_c0_g1_i1.p1  ORF type:complete len:969 (-),score=295.10 TRINITY_DN104_c0_g1_i1:144-3050(-)
MVKSYLRYAHLKTSGVVVSPKGNISYDRSGHFILCPALKDIIVWNMRTGMEVRRFHVSDEHDVTSLELSPDGRILAAGCENGDIVVFSYDSGEIMTTLQGHRGSVLCLRFDRVGTNLASGGNDTNVILWDVVGERGLCTLRGHRDAVTSLCFVSSLGVKQDMKSSTPSFLISSSKDRTMRVWDLDVQHSVQTIANLHDEIWSCDCDGRLLVAGGGSYIRELFVWDTRKLLLQKTELVGEEDGKKKDGSGLDAISEGDIEFLGRLSRKGGDRIETIRFRDDGKFLGVCGNRDKFVELYRVYDDESASSKMKKRIRRRKRKLRKEVEDAGELDDISPLEDGFEVQDFIVPHVQVSSKHRVHTFCFQRSTAASETVVRTKKQRKPKKNELVLALKDNQLEQYKYKKEQTRPLAKFDRAGHRSDIRSLAISFDDSLVATTSSNLLKIYHTKKHEFVRTLECGYGLCCQFLPGNNNIVLVGTKTGEIEIHDLSAATLVESVKAHDGAVWSMSLTPDGRGLASGGADKTVKIWKFVLQSIESESEYLESQDEKKETTMKDKMNLSLSETRRIELADDVLSVCVTPDSRLILVSTLDATVRAFYFDTLKFFLSMYGHKLPVVAMDVSSDGQVLATVSADKNVKLWGLDFGDCHKSIFAHEESIMQIKFVPETHYFVTTSRDGSVKFWDGDSYDHVQTISRGKYEMWALGVSSDGSTIVVAGHDRALHTYERTEEQLFVEEEREKEDDRAFEVELEKDSRVLSTIAEREETESGAVVKPTAESITTSDRLMEAIETAESEEEKDSAFRKEFIKEKGASDAKKIGPLPSSANPLLLGKTPLEYIAWSIDRLRASEIESALNLLPYDNALALCSFLHRIIETGKHVEKCTRCLLFLIRLHHLRLAASAETSYSLLDEIGRSLHGAIQGEKDRIGFNLAALGRIQNVLSEKKSMKFFDVSKVAEAKKKKKKSKRRKVME